jgi:hypothetical protein
MPPEKPIEVTLINGEQIDGRPRCRCVPNQRATQLSGSERQRLVNLRRQEHIDVIQGLGNQRERRRLRGQHHLQRSDWSEAQSDDQKAWCEVGGERRSRHAGQADQHDDT